MQVLGKIIYTTYQRTKGILMQKSFSSCLVMLCFATSSLLAQSMIHPAFKLTEKQVGVELGLSFSDTEYETDNNVQADIDRKTLGLAVAFGMSAYLDIIAQAGMIFEADFEGQDDQGFLVGGAVRGQVYQQDDIMVYALGELIYIAEDYSNSLEASHLSFSLEANFLWSLNEHIDLYGGVGLIPFSDGELDAGAASDVDIERDDLLSVRIGASFDTGRGFFVRPDIKILGEQTFTVSVGRLL